MKKTAAILLILVFQFNLFGYQLLISFLQQQQAVVLESKIDHEAYNESELVQVSISLNMPYQNRNTEFERCYGRVEKNGTTFHYVKRKIAGNELILLCIPNHQSKALYDLKNDVTKANAANQQDNPGKSAPQKASLKAGIDEIDFCTAFFQLNSTTTATKKDFSVYTFTIPMGNSITLLQPPRSC